MLLRHKMEDILRCWVSLFYNFSIFNWQTFCAPDSAVVIIAQAQKALHFGSPSEFWQGCLLGKSWVCEGNRKYFICRNIKMEDKAEYKAPEERTKWQNFRTMLWNSETKECLGRTGLSWFRITIFYIIFYACLAAFWTCMLVIFYQTLANDQPKWTLDSSRIGSSPGLGFRPSPPQDNIDSTLIWFNATRPETVDYWVQNLNDYLEPYILLSTGGSAVHCTADQPAGPDKVCHFPFPTGDDKICSPERKFGYPEGKPCVLIKLNRIFNWEPRPYSEPPEALSEKLTEDFDPSRVYVTCVGENSADRDNIGEVRYSPDQGIASFYFPFTNQKGYVSPFVFVHFENINRGVLVNVECRAWAQNINFDRGDRLGSVHFELLVD